MFDDRDYPVVPCSPDLETKFSAYAPSLTLTAKGFYGPQFRNAQIAPKYKLEEILEMSYRGMTVGNIEMETAGIYGLSDLLGFNAISINALLADRLNGTFSKNPGEVVKRMIKKSLDIICS
jgi:uridine phosphorylase